MCAGGLAHARAEEFRWQLPAGFPEPAVPADNPMSAAKVALGEKLFADPRLSITGQHSCAELPFAGPRVHRWPRAFARRHRAMRLPLNAPTLLNVAYNSSLGWRDAKLRTLEQQMHGPLFNEHPRELGLAGREALVERALLADVRDGARLCRRVSGEDQPVSMDNVIRAIAAYERTLFAGHSAFDRYVFGGDHGRSASGRRPACSCSFPGAPDARRCHGGVNFAGAWVDRDHPQAEPVFADTGTGEAVRVPTLRNLPATAPYMHDGRFADARRSARSL